jgi:hypothetical protein
MQKKLARRAFCCFLAWLMVNSPPVFAKGNSGVGREEEKKTALSRLGQGDAARVLVSLRDSEKVGGYVQQIQDDDFSVRVFCTENDITVSFGRVKGLRGVNVATGTKVSAGKGVSAKLAEGLSAPNPCGLITVKSESGRWDESPLFWIIGGAAIVGIIFWVAISTRD